MDELSLLHVRVKEVCEGLDPVHTIYNNSQTSRDHSLMSVQVSANGGISPAVFIAWPVPISTQLYWLDEFD
jgi:hypothetical protein